MRYPNRVLLVTFDVAQDRIDEGLEASMVHAVEAFDTDALAERYDTALICWSTLYHSRDHYDQADDLPLRKRLIDWVNTQVCPRLSVARRPVWL
jgi:hypothetical protein